MWVRSSVRLVLSRVDADVYWGPRLSAGRSATSRRTQGHPQHARPSTRRGGPKQKRMPISARACGRARARLGWGPPARIRGRRARHPGRWGHTGSTPRRLLPLERRAARGQAGCAISARPGSNYPTVTPTITRPQSHNYLGFCTESVRAGPGRPRAAWAGRRAAQVTNPLGNPIIWGRVIVGVIVACF